MLIIFKQLFDKSEFYLLSKCFGQEFNGLKVQMVSVIATKFCQRLRFSVGGVSEYFFVCLCSACMFAKI